MDVVKNEARVAVPDGKNCTTAGKGRGTCVLSIVPAPYTRHSQQHIVEQFVGEPGPRTIPLERVPQCTDAPIVNDCVPSFPPKCAKVPHGDFAVGNVSGQKLQAGAAPGHMLQEELALSPHAIPLGADSSAFSDAEEDDDIHTLFARDEALKILGTLKPRQAMQLVSEGHLDWLFNAGEHMRADASS